MKTKPVIESSAILEQVEYIHSPRAKYLRITIRPGGIVRVTVPKNGSLRQAQDFVRAKKGWIQKTLKRLETMSPKRERPAVTDDMIAQQGILFDRLKELAVKHGFRYRNAGIRNQKSRWGSCSSRNNISLNIHLLTLPRHLRDYVILHELVHTEHKNHSKRFWARLDEVMDGKSRALRKEMQKFRIMI